MKDTIIKETGNSRFLRSALPAGTSWEDALAMFIAGTFPIDLAGINKEGIETLGMALNKENLLNDDTETAIWGDAADRKPTEALMKIFKTLSAGVSEKAKIVTGTYTGTQTVSGTAYKSQTINLGFRPKAVIVSTTGASLETYTQYNAMALDGRPIKYDSSGPILEILDDGFKVGSQTRIYSESYYSYVHPILAEKSRVYTYIAIA